MPSILPDTAEVVVIGGGVIGTSIAYHLAARGCTDVVVLERGRLGEGSTARASGGIRQQFGHEVEVRLARDSVLFWQDFEERMEGHLSFRQVGYLYLLTTPAEVERFTRNVELQQRIGVPSRLLRPAEILELVPLLRLDGVLAGAFCPTDGRAVPAGAVDGYARQARRLGARLIEDVDVRAIRVAAGRVRGVETTAGRVAAPLVIDAAGPQAAVVAAMVGIDLPVYPKRLHQFVTGPVAGLPPDLPCVAEPATTLFVAPEGQGVLLGMDRPEASSTNTLVDWDFLPEVIRTATHRLPSIEQSDIRTAWAGLIEQTPDGLPIVGKVPDVEGFILANGMNGHGFMLSPAIGRAVAELVLDGVSSSVDVGELGIERFCPAIADPN